MNTQSVIGTVSARKDSGALLLLVAFSALLVPLPGGFAQSGNASKPLKLKGVITDSMCGAKHMTAGDDAKCVRTCVKGGSHYALLVGDKVYDLAGHDEDLDKLSGKTVTVAGTMNDAGAIQLTSVQPATSVAAKSAAPTPAPDPPAPPTVVIEGLVRDIACPIQNPSASARDFNLKCALECVRLGSPVIIQTDAGVLYMPMSSSMPDQDQRPRLTPFVGKYVRVRGQVYERKGTRAIMIQDITELKDVHLKTEAE